MRFLRKKKDNNNNNNNGNNESELRDGRTPTLPDHPSQVGLQSSRPLTPGGGGVSGRSTSAGRASRNHHHGGGGGGGGAVQQQQQQQQQQQHYSSHPHVPASFSRAPSRSSAVSISDLSSIEYGERDHPRGSHHHHNKNNNNNNTNNTTTTTTNNNNGNHHHYNNNNNDAYMGGADSSVQLVSATPVGNRWNHTATESIPEFTTMPPTPRTTTMAMAPMDGNHSASDAGFTTNHHIPTPSAASSSSTTNEGRQQNSSQLSSHNNNSAAAAAAGAASSSISHHLNAGLNLDEELERNAVTRELVKRFVSDIWNRGEVDLIPHVCSPGLRFNGSVGMDRVGHDGFARMVRTIRDALADYHCEIHSMVVEGNKAFCRMRFTGRHTGSLLGYPPTGGSVAWMGAAEFTVHQERIFKVWELGDVKSLEGQLSGNIAAAAAASDAASGGGGGPPPLRQRPGADI